MPVYLSPGVYTREIDLSLYIPNLSTTALGLVGLAVKGPINVPTFLSNTVQFATTFGDPNPSFMGPYGALQFLHTGRQLWYVRVAEQDPAYDPETADPFLSSQYLAKYAAANVGEYSSRATVTGAINSPITFTATNNILTFVVDGIADGLTVTFDIPGVLTEVNYSIPKIATLLNTDATFFTYLSASVSQSGGLVIQRKVGGPEHTVTLDVASTAKALFGFPDAFVAGTAVAGAGNTTEQAYLIGSDVVTADGLDTSDPHAALAFSIQKGIATPEVIVAPFTTHGATTPLATIVSELNAAFTAANKPIVASTAYTGAANPQLMVALVGDPAGATAYDHLAFGAVGNFSEIIPEVPEVLDPPTPLVPAVPAVPYVDIKAALFGAAPVTKEDASIAATTMRFRASSQGSWGNNIAVAIYNVAYDSVDPAASTFDLSVYEKGYLVESYQDMSKKEQIRNVYDPGPEDAPNMIDNPKYILTLNDTSSRLQIDIPVGQELIPPVSTGVQPTIRLAGGSNGAPNPNVSDPSLYIGVNQAYTKTGLQFFRNPEELDLNIVAVPGISDAAVINEMIDLCQSRADCMAVIDPPLNYTPQNVVDWRNGAGIFRSEHQAFNSSYAALYWPWLQIYCPVNRVKVWTPPSGHVTNAYAYTDYTTETWFAPAGLTRGRLVTPLKAEYIPTLGERDLLYANSVNPIATFIRDGINIWGQKTLQTIPSALDRVNVRRLMLYLEKVIASTARVLLFEPNDRITWNRFVNLVTPFLEGVRGRRGLVDFQVRCDETTNTPDRLDRNEMVGIIFIKPTKAAEFIQIDFVLTAQGANFDELVY